jgi:hypothetical protein
MPTHHCMPAQAAGEWGAVAEWEWGAEGDLGLSSKIQSEPQIEI